MSYNVITIARTLYSGGEEVGRRLADEFGFRYVDNEIIERAAALAGVTPEEMARTEVPKGLIERILESFALAGGGSDAPSAQALDKLPGYEGLIVDVIREMAAGGNAVIVAHGAAIALAGSKNVLRVLVTASPETRIGRLVIEGKTQSEAEKLVAKSDAGRADFFERFYRLEAEEPTHYDIVINTDQLGFDQADGIIRALARA